ncbi:hypothetical protein D3C72_1608790 [compost metagenome]
MRAYLDQGVRPHINLHGVRYTNSVLATSTHLIGHQLLIYMNADDLRSVRAFLADGGELGVLDAQGAWRVVPHNLKLRQEIRRQAGKRHNHSAAAANPIETYVKEKVAQAKKTRKAATELAHVMRVLAAAPTTRTPPGPPRATDRPTAAQSATTSADATPTATDAEPSTRPTARARKLSIGTGQVF